MAKQKWICRVVGHNEIQSKRVPGKCRITMRGADIPGLKIEFVVDESERDLYPYGTKGVFAWDEQQSMNLDPPKPEPAAKPAKKNAAPAETEAPALAGATAH